MNGRTLLRDALKAALPNWQVVSDSRVLDPVRKPAAAVLWTQRRKRLELNGIDMLSDTLTLWVLTASDKPAQIEDDLDARLHEVLEVLEDAPQFTWQECERGVLAETFNGWRIDVTCAYKITTT